MIRRRKMPVSLVMVPQEQHRLASVLMLLIAIDQRVNAQQVRTKKAKKLNIAKGSLNSGPYFFIRLYGPDFAPAVAESFVGHGNLRAGSARPASPYPLFLIPLKVQTFFKWLLVHLTLPLLPFYLFTCIFKIQQYKA